MTGKTSTNGADAGWNFDNSYTRLPAELFERVAPTPVARPAMAIFNRSLAGGLGLDAAALDGDAGAELFAGNRLPAGADPVAQAYAGHQFGHFTMLGDGRAILLGEQLAPGGRRLDVQLKGSGRTPFSRRGDGRAALGPMLREHILGEAMHALGIPTTRSLAVVTTGEPVLRDRPLRGAVLTRIAASHLRVGTFQYAAACDNRGLLEALVTYALRRHYPELEGAASPALALLEAVTARQAALIARWMAVGFVHGVMNTDNMSICGETIDYGPCAFLDAYHAGAVFSSIDHHGRYAHGNQPQIAQWNLARLAEALLPSIDANPERALDRAGAAIGQFAAHYRRHWLDRMRAKLGLFGGDDKTDFALAEQLLDCMQAARADFTNTFRALTGAGTAALPTTPRFLEWMSAWKTRQQHQCQNRREAAALMQTANPAFIPRNHQVEAALAAACEQDNYGPLTDLLAILATPFQEQQGAAEFQSPAPADAPPYLTFCGT